MPRRPPHFKVMVSAKNHEKLAYVWRDNDLLALWVRLGVEAVARFADRTADTFLVHDRELPAITGKGRLDVARTWLRRLADVSPISARRDADVWRITFPNFAKKQGFGSKNGAETGASSSSSSSSSSSVGKEKTEEKREEKRPRARARRHRLPETDPPESPDDPSLAGVFGWAQENHPGVPREAIALAMRRCLNHFRSNEARKRDWPATCRNWIDGDAQRGHLRAPGARQVTARASPAQARLDRTMATARRYVRRSEGDDAAGEGHEDDDLRPAVRHL